MRGPNSVIKMSNPDGRIGGALASRLLYVFQPLTFFGSVPGSKPEITGVTVLWNFRGAERFLP